MSGFVFQVNFNVDREAFQIVRFPHVSPRKSIYTSLVL